MAAPVIARDLTINALWVVAIDLDNCISVGLGKRIVLHQFGMTAKDHTVHCQLVLHKY